MSRGEIQSQRSFTKYADDCEPVRSTIAYLLNYLYTGTETHIYLYTCTARMCVLHTSKRQLLKAQMVTFLCKCGRLYVFVLLASAEGECSRRVGIDLKKCGFSASRKQVSQI